jgi:hypothetical protein
MPEPTLLDRAVAVAYVLSPLLQAAGFFLLAGAGCFLWGLRGFDAWALGLGLAGAGWLLCWAGFRRWAWRWGRRRWSREES